MQRSWGCIYIYISKFLMLCLKKIFFFLFLKQEGDFYRRTHHVDSLFNCFLFIMRPTLQYHDTTVKHPESGNCKQGEIKWKEYGERLPEKNEEKCKIECSVNMVDRN